MIISFKQKQVLEEYPNSGWAIHNKGLVKNGHDIDKEEEAFIRSNGGRLIETMSGGKPITQIMFF